MAQLPREGMGINRKTVACYMREMGIAAIYPGPNLICRNQQEQIYPYLLRHLICSYPNHVWGIDITSIRMHAGWMYLVAILDWYSRSVVSWELDQTREFPFVLTAHPRYLNTLRSTHPKGILPLDPCGRAYPGENGGVCLEQ